MQSCACPLTTQRSDEHPTRVNDGAYQEDRDASGDGLVALLPPAQLLRIHISADDAVYGLSGAFSEEEEIVAPRESAMGACLLASTIQVQVAGPASNDGVMFAAAAAGRRSAACTPQLCSTSSPSLLPYIIDMAYIRESYNVLERYSLYKYTIYFLP